LAGDGQHLPALHTLPTVIALALGMMRIAVEGTIGDDLDLG